MHQHSPLANDPSNEGSFARGEASRIRGQGIARFEKERLRLRERSLVMFKKKKGTWGKKITLQKLFLFLIFMAGLAVFLYPVISNAINSRYQSYAVSVYDEEAAKISFEEKERLKKEAEAYNARLKGGAVITDPFGGGKSAQGGISYMDMLNIGEAMGHLEIPKLSLNLPIYHGTSDDVLSRGIGHIEQSSLPVGGMDTNAVLTGHRGLPTSTLFRYLNEMETGDLFFIHTLDETLAYQVFEIVVVTPKDIKKLKIERGRDLVTLVTCDPYMLNYNRLLVRGERIPYTESDKAIETPVETKAEVSSVEVVETPANIMDNGSSDSISWQVLGLIAITSCSVLGFTLWRLKGRKAGDRK